MQGNPDHQTGFNLVLCYYALEDGLSMKKAFQRLAAIPVQACPPSDYQEWLVKAYVYDDGITTLTTSYSTGDRPHVKGGAFKSLL